LEKVYEICLCHEISKKGLIVERQVYIPIAYDGIIFQEGLRLDLLVNKCIICEIKAIEAVNPVWDAQIISHLKLTGYRIGLLINFNVSRMKEGIKRFAV
jgi:GxxExxY protein